jgi:hypothetical protein
MLMLEQQRQNAYSALGIKKKLEFDQDGSGVAVANTHHTRLSLVRKSMSNSQAAIFSAQKQTSSTLSVNVTA